MTDSQLLIGIMQNDERAWKHICKNMKQGFTSILVQTFQFSNLTNEDIEDIFQESLIVLMQTQRLLVRRFMIKSPDMQKTWLKQVKK